MRILGIALCLTALGLTGYSALVYKAPKIEADIERRTVQVVSALAGNEVEVHVDGRQVTLAGRIDDEQERQRVLGATAALAGVLGPIDKLERAGLTRPYHFGAVKDEEGRVAVKGLAPSVEAKAAIEAGARALFGDEASIEIEIAAGGPSGDWPTATGSALDALATMRHGKVTITDSNVVLEGEVSGDGDIEAIDLFAETVPEGFTWTHDVKPRRETVEPFTFSVVKKPEGGLRLSGFAPDEETRSALIDQAKAVGESRPVIADIQIADGMPDQEWPSLVQAGIVAIRDMEAGRLDVVGNDVSFSSDPGIPGEEGGPDGQPTPAATSSAKTDLPPSTDLPLPAADGPVDAALAPNSRESRSSPSPTVDSLLTVDKVNEGVWSARGVVPDQHSKDELVSVIKKHAGVEDVEIEVALAGHSRDEQWLRFATDHIRTLDEVQAGRLSIEEYDTHLIGVVETLEDIEPVGAALSAIDQSMIVDLQPIDPRPAASLDLSLSPDAGIVLAGTLPEGLSEGEALLALGIQRYAGNLDENGRGPAAEWQRDLSEIGALLPAFEAIDLSLDGEQSTIEGRVHARDDADVIARELAGALSHNRQPLIAVETSTVVHQDGDGRTSPLTGGQEVYRQGFWLPVIELQAGREICDERAATMLATDKVTFGRGQEDLDHRARAILNALAALAAVCLDDTDLALEIGGHTDARGGARMNEELSQARADAVRKALAARGVDTEALIAIGYGDSQPIADNATEKGRAANRRITFEWKPPTEARSSEAEG